MAKRSPTDIAQNKDHYIKELEQINMFSQKIIEMLNKKEKESDLDANISQLETASRYSKDFLQKVTAFEPSHISNEILEAINHNLRTPLTSIKAYTNLILQERIGSISEAQKEKLQIVSTDIQNLQDVITKLFHRRQ